MALFSKDKETTNPPRSSPPANRPDGPASDRVSVIGNGVRIEGKVTGSDNLLVEGQIVGEVHIASDLRIGKSAHIEATVHAANVIVEGKLTGDLSADRRVELVAGSSVDGNIRAPKIVVAEGARFRGSVDMGSAKPAAQGEAAKK